VPIHPELVTMLRDHLNLHVEDDPDSRIFVGKRGGPITDRIYLKVFHEARKRAITPAEAASPLMAVPYTLRHAAVSTWLRTSGDAAQVAEWAGHSSAVLLKVYAKCVHGTEDETLTRIWNATRR
jgi:integrase